MGIQIRASCNCGVNADVQIGGGMMDFTTSCLFPCLCNNCHSIVDANLLAKDLRCSKCRGHDLIPYDDPRNIGTLGPRKLANWNVQDSLGRELILTDGTYKCPKCGKMSLTFDDDSAENWD